MSSTHLAPVQALLLLVLGFLLAPASASAQSLTLSKSSVTQGESVTADWSGFPSNVNLPVYRNGVLWTYANTDVNGSGNQVLDTSSWSPGSYSVRAELRSNVTVYAEAPLSVAAPNPSASLSKDVVALGSSVTLSWSGFGGKVNLPIFRNGTFWIYAATNVDGSGSQVLSTQGWQASDDYVVRVELRAQQSTKVDLGLNVFDLAAASVSVNPASVEVGERARAEWAGWPGPINLEVHKGQSHWVDANTNVPGTGSQDLDTTSWEARSDYRVRAVLRNDPTVFKEASLEVRASTPNSPPTPPQITPPGGSFVGSVKVSLETLVVGGEIHFTTDGSAPGASSPRYSAPITLTADATVRGVVIVPGGASSAVASKSFVIAPSGTGSSNLLPAMAGEQLRCDQGNNSLPSHNLPSTEDGSDLNQGSQDYDEGMPILASADGVIESVTSDVPNDTGVNFGNDVRSRQDNGVDSHDAHMLRNSAAVLPRERVMQGQVIGRVGNTGWSSAPHWHHAKLDSSKAEIVTVPSRFADVPGDGVPKAGSTYTSQNSGVFDRAAAEHGSKLGPEQSPIGWIDAQVRQKELWNAYQRKHQGGVLLYDALNGARRAVLLRDGFLGYWESRSPSSELGLPLTDEYEYERPDGTRVARQDFADRRGTSDRSLTWENGQAVETQYVAPGRFERSDSRTIAHRWSPAFSGAFVEGFRQVVGEPGPARIGDALRGVEEREGLLVQEFLGSYSEHSGRSYLILNEELAKVFHVRGAFAAELERVGLAATGAPASEERETGGVEYQEFQKGTLSRTGGQVTWSPGGLGGAQPMVPPAGGGGGGGGGCSLSLNSEDLGSKGLVFLLLLFPWIVGFARGKSS